jgi:hypothetical protein
MSFGATRRAVAIIVGVAVVALLGVSAALASERGTSLSAASVSAPAYSTNVSASKSFSVSWSGVSASAYDVQVKLGLAGAWQPWQSATTTTKASYTAPAAGTCFFRARGRSGAEVGPWSAVASTVVPTDDAASQLKYKGTWTRTSTAKSSAFSKTLHTSVKAGATCTYSFTGRSVALICVKGPKHGKLQIFIDGASKAAATIDTLSSKLRPRQVVFTRTWSTSGAHSLKVMVLGTRRRPKVEIDAAAAPELDSSPPTGDFAFTGANVVSLGGQPYAKARSITLGVTAADPANVASVGIATTSSVGAATWSDFAATLPVELTAGDGAKQLYLWFRDDLGNQSTAPITHQVTLDTAPPVFGAVTGNVTFTPGQAKTVSAQVSDAGAGLQGVTLHYRTAGASSFTDLAMSLSGGSWSANVPAAALNSDTIEYYLEAADRLGLTAQQPVQTPSPSYYELVPTDSVPPVAPTLLIGNVDAAGVELSWQPVLAGDLSHYNILRATTLGGSYSKIGESTSTSYTDATALRHRTYYYEVTAEDYSGNVSAPSSPTKVILPAVLASFGVNAPSAATVGQPFTVAITAYDTNSDVMTSYSGTASLSVVGGSGSLSPTSVGGFASGVASVQVTYSATGSIQIQASDGDATGTSATIGMTTQPVLDHIDVTPSPARLLHLNDTQQFAATGYTSTNEDFAITPTWSVQGGIGTVSASGLFTATHYGSGTVVATGGAVNGAALVTVAHEVSGSIAANTTWTAAQSPYTVTGDVTVPAGKTLTLQAGVVVKFQHNTGLNVAGTLACQGTTGSKVVLTAFSDDSYGGDSDGDGGANPPSKGYWTGVTFAANSDGSVLTDTLVRYAQTGIDASNASFTLTGSTIEQCAYDGIDSVTDQTKSTTAGVTVSASTVEDNGGAGIYARLTNSDVNRLTPQTPTISGDTISDNGGQGINVYAHSITSAKATLCQPTIANNVISNDGSGAYQWALEVHADLLTPTLSTNSGTGNLCPAMALSGTIAGNWTWVKNATLTPTLVGDSSTGYGVTVPAGKTLTVAPGAVVKGSWSNAGLNVNGILLAQGTAADPVVFTSAEDDSYGGDTNADGISSTPVPGDWGGVGFGANSDGSVLDHVKLDYGAYGVQAQDASFTLTNSEVAFFSYVGVYLTTDYGKSTPAGGDHPGQHDPRRARHRHRCPGHEQQRQLCHPADADHQWQHDHRQPGSGHQRLRPLDHLGQGHPLPADDREQRDLGQRLLGEPVGARGPRRPAFADPLNQLRLGQPLPGDGPLGYDRRQLDLAEGRGLRAGAGGRGQLHGLRPHCPSRQDAHHPGRRRGQGLGHLCGSQRQRHSARPGHGRRPDRLHLS